MIVAVTAGDFKKVLCSPIPPAALAKTKGEFGRDIASADDFAELSRDVIRVIPLNNI